MSIDAHGLAFIAILRDHGVDFGSTCMIGRQHLSVTARDLSKRGFDPRLATCQFAEPLFHELGAARVESLDYSSFEGATIQHDLNQSEPPAVGRFTAVIDGGTLEHVFHAPNAVASVLSLVQIGGHLAVISPTDGHSGHGFYQFSPEFWFRVLSADNGFAVQRALLHETNRGWFEVTDPAALGRRVGISSVYGAYLYVLAQRISDAAPLGVAPSQSDYELAWSSARPEDRMQARVIRRMPQGMAAVVRRVRRRRPGLRRTVV